MRPVQAGAGEQPDGALVQPGMHPVPVELDLVQPLRPFRRGVDQFGECGFIQLGSTAVSARWRATRCA